jgi:NAD(P)H-quinone oxidoreductase subunit 5
VQNGLWVWVVYRISDAALLLAALVMHHLRGEGDFNGMLGGDAWPAGHAVVSSTASLTVGLLLIIAAIGKSALAPFSGWLPRAMEGPTPSSAIFYGALSVHLGAFILLRISPLLDDSYILSAIVVVIGLATAIHAYVVGSVQSDIKSALCYASLVQVGLIVAEIGFGLRYIALIHLLGNACLRTLQLIRAPSVLQDYHRLENAIGDHLSQDGGPARWAPSRVRAWLYRYALERGYFDIMLAEWIAMPFVRMFLWFDRQEERWISWLSGKASNQKSTPIYDRFEELP